MNTHQRLKVLCLSASLVLVTVTQASAQSTSLHGKVLEGALVNFDPKSGTATVTPCRKCRKMFLKVTEATEIVLDGKAEPFTADTEIGGLVDTMYDTRDKSVLWFRPLSVRRK